MAPACTLQWSLYSTEREQGSKRTLDFWTSVIELEISREGRICLTATCPPPPPPSRHFADDPVILAPSSTRPSSAQARSVPTSPLGGPPLIALHRPSSSIEELDRPLLPGQDDTAHATRTGNPLVKINERRDQSNVSVPPRSRAPQRQGNFWASARLAIAGSSFSLGVVRTGGELPRRGARSERQLDGS